MLTWIANKLTKFVYQYAEDKSHTYSGVRDITITTTEGSILIYVIYNIFCGYNHIIEIPQIVNNDTIILIHNVKSDLLNDAINILTDISTLYAWYYAIDSSFTYSVQGE